jgi:heme A synthase
VSAAASRGVVGSGFRHLVAGTTFATWMLVAVVGVVRVSESGLGCPDWPLCGGRAVPVADKEPIVEYAHRATAAIVIALLVVATISAFRRNRAPRDIAVPLALALGLVPLQAVLGAVVVWLELPDRLVGVHFMVGMAMLALCTYAWVASWSAVRVVSPLFARTAVVAGVAGLVLVSLGAAVVATDAMHACGEQWPACNGGIADGGRLAVLQVVHRSTAYAVAAVALLLVLLGVRGHAPLEVALPPGVLTLGQIGLGVGMVVSAHGSLQHDVFRILHVAGGAAVWASIVVVVTVAAAHSVGVERRASQPIRATRLSADHGSLPS